MKVKEIMTKKVISVFADTPVSDVASLLFDQDLTGMPVINKQKKIIGIVTEYDLMSNQRHIHIPSYIDFLKTFSSAKHERDKRVKLQIDSILATKVEDIMTKKVVCIGPQDSVVEIADIFVKQRINPLPVVSKDNILVGIISRADIVKLFKKKNK